MTEAKATALLPPDVRLLEGKHGEFAFCMWRETLIVAWPPEPDLVAVQRFKRVIETLMGEKPDKGSSVHLVAEGTAVPNGEARAALIDMMQNNTDGLECLSVVLNGHGFWASALRSVIVGMRMVTTRSYALAFHGDTASAAKWLAQEVRTRGGVAFDAAELARVLDAVCRYVRP